MRKISKHKGIVVNVDQKTGLGQISSSGFGESLPFYRDAVLNGSPKKGQKVLFRLKTKGEGQECYDVWIAQKSKSPVVFFGVISGILLLFLFLLFSPKMNSLLAYLLAINLLTFVFYAYDKRMSTTEYLRIPEVVLHFLALLGATPMAFIAQHLFRHKTSKEIFLRVFWIIVVFQFLVLLTWCYFSFLN